ncbi:hypothetical protein FBQ97_12040 [Acidobacteria bacterium ACD]|nr:hypothetical protein [Acidobacteria bacterium ACD]
MATISAGLVAPAVIEISGLPALLLLLAPFAILLIVIVCLRGSRPSPPPVRESEMQRAIPAAEELAPAPATAGSGPQRRAVAENDGSRRDHRGFRAVGGALGGAVGGRSLIPGHERF